jgi:hypothetical protein
MSVRIQLYPAGEMPMVFDGNVDRYSIDGSLRFTLTTGATFDTTLPFFVANTTEKSDECQALQDEYNAKRLHDLAESLSEPNNGFVSLEEANRPVSELTDRLLRDYSMGAYSEDLKHRGVELARELLEARERIRGLSE